MNPFNWNEAFKPRGLAGATSAPMNVEEIDLPPGAPPYAGGPLANPKPSATPGTRSATESDLPPGTEGTYFGGPLANPNPTPSPPPNLQTLAAGGFNHQEAWMAGQLAPTELPKQAPFSQNLAASTPVQPDENLLKQFSFSSMFNYA